MFGYYGSKSKVVNYYPRPIYNKIIEPFAGSAKYSLKWFDRDILLVDKYEFIIKIWQWLQKCSINDIKQLPEPSVGHDIRNYKFDCDEAQMLMRFMVGGGLAHPQWIVTSRAKIPHEKRRIANDLYKIKHWKIVCGDYNNIENEKATWYIDPPYQFGGDSYFHGNKNIDFQQLAQWCKCRNGQVIVCENTKADWLPFNPMKKMHGSKFDTTEAIWSNQKTIYENTQLSLL